VQLEALENGLVQAVHELKEAENEVQLHIIFTSVFVVYN